MRTFIYLLILLAGGFHSLLGQAPDQPRGQVTLYYFDFNDSEMPSGWTIGDSFNDGHTWKFYHASNYNVGYPFGDSLMAVNSAAAGAAYMDEYLTTSYFNCGAGEDVYLCFSNYFKWKNNTLDEVGDVYVRNGSTDTWSLLLTMTNMSFGPETRVFDLTPYIETGDSVQLKFRYSNARNDYFWLIDNIVLYYECEDPDNDNRCSSFDNCPNIFNPYQEDFDNDGIGDICDDCMDTDGDGYGNPGYGNDCTQDNCPDVYNHNQFDSDEDGIGDACDSCTDVDGDGYGVPDFPGNTCPNDNCAGVYNPGQEDADGDGVGDACDQCTDLDGDGYGDPGYPANTCLTDNCPDLDNPGQEDADGDGVGDVCDSCTDLDGDGYGDPGYPANTCLTDNCPGVANPDQEDADGDGVGDVCDSCTDLDGDGYGDPGYPANTCLADNCPGLANPDQDDADGDSVGDACDICPYHEFDDCCNPLGQNNKPQLTSSLQIILAPGDSVNYQPEATDPDCDGDELTFSYDYFPEWCQLAGDQLTGIAGCGTVDSSFELIVSDGTLQDTAVVEIVIDHSNQAPQVIDTISTILLRDGTWFSYRPQIDDPDDEIHSVSYLDLPDWCSVDADSIFGIVPLDTLIENVTVRVEDYCNYDEYSFDLRMYICGDASHDKVVDVSDAVFIISYAFSGTTVPPVMEAADTNCDQMVDVSDAVYLINYIFSQGPAPCADCD
jgi:hypothetical protein